MKHNFNQPKNRIFRLGFVLLGFFFLFMIIWVRLYFLQIYKTDKFLNLAKKQYGIKLKLDSPRGIIYDRSGKTPLALNQIALSAFILPSNLTEKDKTLDFLRQNYKSVYDKLKANPKKKFLWLKRRLTEKDFEEFQNLGLADIHFLSEPKRFYPFLSLSQVIGFTDVDNNGICGLELLYDLHLKGIPSKFEVEKEARSGKFYFNKNVISQGVDGKPLCLTIDSTLQSICSEELKSTIDEFEAQSGAIIIMNPTNGEILSMASYPFVDSNNNIEELNNTKNICVSECYELGSVIKAFCALSALEEKVVDLDELIDCHGKEMYFGNFKVENPHFVEVATFSDVIKNSSNVGIAKIAQRLGKKYYKTLMRLGFGSLTNIGFPGERDGFVMPPHKWSKSSLIVLAFGYEITASLIQLCRAFGIIANDGYDVVPTLIKNDSKNNIQNKLFEKESIEQLKTILEKIGSRYGPAGFKCFGKTGTARLIENGAYTNKRHIYTFVGTIAKDSYKRVIVTFIREPRQSNLWASGVSAPLFKRIAQRMVIYDFCKTIAG